MFISYHYYCEDNAQNKSQVSFTVEKILFQRPECSQTLCVSMSTGEAARVPKFRAREVAGDKEYFPWASGREAWWTLPDPQLDLSRWVTLCSEFSAFPLLPLRCIVSSLLSPICIETGKHCLLLDIPIQPNLPCSALFGPVKYCLCLLLLPKLIHSVLISFSKSQRFERNLRASLSMEIVSVSLSSSLAQETHSHVDAVAQNAFLS